MLQVVPIKKVIINKDVNDRYVIRAYADNNPEPMVITAMNMIELEFAVNNAFTQNILSVRCPE